MAAECERLRAENERLRQALADYQLRQADEERRQAEWERQWDGLMGYTGAPGVAGKGVATGEN